MEREKIILHIVGNKSFTKEPELENWINQERDNKEEYIRYKNLWALMQTGSGITDNQIRDGLRKINARNYPGVKTLNLLKYAAIAVVAFLSGYLVNQVVIMGHGGIDKRVLYVSSGIKSAIVLPDSTRVWLSQGSKLVFPEKFCGKNKIVELEGVGFFEVNHNQNQPFVVKIGKSKIKVSAPKFTFAASPQDDVIKAELISGRIQFNMKGKNSAKEIRSFLMKTSQSVTFDKCTGKFSETKIPDNFYNYWINGVYEFKNESFSELAKKMERIYNVKIIFENELIGRQSISGSLYVNDNIYTQMETLKRNSLYPFIYDAKGNQIYIKNLKTIAYVNKLKKH